MKFRYVSDIHNEFERYQIPSAPEDTTTVLIIAGDFYVSNKRTHTLTTLLRELSERFKAVIFVLGNHDYWNSSITSAVKLHKQIVSQFNNVFVLQQDVVEIDGVVIAGCTLWTDFNNDDPFLKMHVVDRYTGMVDFKKIRHGPPSCYWQRRITPSDVINLHYDDVRFLQQSTTSSPTIWVVHHGVTQLSASTEQFPGVDFTGCYVSDLSNAILDSQPNVIVHGHVHQSKDYMVGNTRVLCNPKGYPFEVNPLFDPYASFDV